MLNKSVKVSSPQPQGTESCVQCQTYTGLKKLKLKVPYDAANLLLRVYPKEQKSESQRDTSVPSYTVALFMLIKM